MHAIGAYLVSVTAAALICGIAKMLLPDGTLGAALKMATGLLMVLAVVSPWADIRIPDLSGWALDYQLQAENAANQGAESAADALRQGISQQVQTYILDKASTLDAELTVEVELTDDSLPVPCAVTLQGRISPYAKSVLSEYLKTELGIGTEAQIWIN